MTCEHAHASSADRCEDGWQGVDDLSFDSTSSHLIKKVCKVCG